MAQYEPEFEPIIPPVDKVYEADANGDLKEVEVPDDVTDD
jgi:hypothetical protein